MILMPMMTGCKYNNNNKKKNIFNLLPYKVDVQGTKDKQYKG